MALYRPDPHVDMYTDSWCDERDKALVGVMLLANHMYWYRAVNKKE